MAGVVLIDTLASFAKHNGSEPDKTPGAGTHRKGATSLAAIGATLVPTILTAAAFMLAFFYLRPKYRNIYTPRTYYRTIPQKDRTPTTRPGDRKWYHDFLTFDDKFILRHQALEGYLFLRFFRVIIIICFVGCCLTWPILLPVNATGGGEAKQLDRLSFSNATGKNTLYAHAIVAWVFVAFIVLMVTRERMFLIGIKQAYVSTKRNATRLSSRTVLFLSAPTPAFQDENLKRFFGPHAKRSWKCPRLSELQSLVNDRNDIVYALEEAEITLTKRANGQTSQTTETDGVDTGPRQSLLENGSDGGPDPSVRPTTRTIPLVGQKVDKIDRNLSKLSEITETIQSKREAFFRGSHRSHGAIFVEFEDQLSAHQALESVRHHSPLALQPRFIGVQPKEVLWDNLNLDTSAQILYEYLSIAVMAATIILWSIPVGIVGTVSNIDSLTDRYKFLGFINNLPSPILGFLQGFLPSFLLGLLVSYVPYWFRYISKISGAPTTVEAEQRTQKWYFAFQLIQVFLVTTFTSGAAAVVTKIIERPKMIPSLLADNLPKAANFYLSYFIIQGIASTAKDIINYSDLIEYILYDKFIDKTPRQKYDRLAFMRGASWGSVYPKFTNLTVIAIVYSCIAPLMLGFATIGFFLFYLSWRYALFYTRQVKLEMRGDGYGRALQHLLAGVYLLELCLFGLLSAREAEGPATLILVLFAVTVLYHVTVNKYLSPLERYMPVDVLTGQEEDQSLLSAEETTSSPPGGRTQNSFLHSLKGGKLPTILLDPLAVILEPRILASHESLKPWLSDDRDRDGDGVQDDLPQYSEQDITNAYLNPCLTSKTPKVWLVRDRNEVSKWEIEKNKSAGVESTDEGAELDKHNNVKWDKDDLSKAPIFKEPKVF